MSGLAAPAHSSPDDGLIPPLKDVYSDYFKAGNIYSGPQTYAEDSPNWAQVERHYNIMTAENNMKPDQLLRNSNINTATGAWNFTFDAADYFVDETINRGMDVHGHVLVWHSQTPAKLYSGTRAEAKANMERYIKTVLEHFKDSGIVSWDVVNEAFADGVDSFDPATEDWRTYLRGAPRDYATSGWYTAYSTDMDVTAGETPGDFIYDAFYFARKYDPDIKLEYNDFNVFQSEGKAEAILAMAKELNARYAAENPGDRQLIETIGLQSHNYINQTPAFACSDLTRLPGLVNEDAEEWQPGACSDHASVERSLQLITEAGFTASVSELDLQVFEAWNAEPQGSNGPYYDLDDPAAANLFSKPGFTYWEGKIQSRAELEAIQAQRYAEYFAVYKKYSQDMDRVTFWGLTDFLNWRRNHNPQLFNRDWTQKLSALAVADPEGWLGLKKPITDTSRLLQAIDEAKALDLRGTVYTGKSLGALKGAIGRANATVQSGRSQAEVNAAHDEVVGATAGLKLK